ncbi:MAG TPA: hypothetical protein VK277_00055 [Acidimicrobiales bacterium]|nr:hypothetical protein [Acidimicrobiales bacterium]
MTRRRREWWGRRPGAAILGLAAGAALLAGCTAVRNDLGTSNGPCYVALPAATAAVHGQGSLVGVRLENVSALTHLHAIYRTAHVEENGKPVQRVCLVAFSGHFRSSSVHLPKGRKRGKLAVVVVEYPDNRVLGTVIIRRFPVHFGHSHLLSAS